MLQGIGILAVICLVVGGMPGARAYDGINEDDKYYWDAHTVAHLQVNEEGSILSFRDSDAIIDGYDPHKDWGEIRFDQKSLYANPLDWENDRELIGHVRPYIHVYKPYEASRANDLVFPMLITYIVHQPGDYYAYDLGGFTTRYSTHTNHRVRQMDGDAFPFELGGTNANAPGVSAGLEDYMENMYEYGVGRTLGMTGGTEIQAALNMVRTWNEGNEDPPDWSQDHDYIAEREKIEYSEDDDSYDGRYMTFWEKIDLAVPTDPNGPTPEESTLKIQVDGFAAGYAGHMQDYTDTEWTINIHVTDDLEDGSSSSGSFPSPPPGGGGTGPIPIGDDDGVTL